MFYTIKYNSQIFIGIILSISLNYSLFSQSDSSGYYARQKFIKDSIRICRPKSVYPQLALDNRKSFIRNSPVDIRGFYAGILFKSRFKFGIGYYQVASEGRINRKTKDKQVPTIRDLELYYTTFNFEFLAVNKRYIKLGLPLDLGYGYSNVSIYDENKIKLLYHSVGNFVPASIGT